MRRTAMLGVLVALAVGLSGPGRAAGEPRRENLKKGHEEDERDIRVESTKVVREDTLVSRTLSDGRRRLKVTRAIKELTVLAAGQRHKTRNATYAVWASDSKNGSERKLWSETTPWQPDQPGRMFPGRDFRLFDVVEEEDELTLLLRCGNLRVVSVGLGPEGPAKLRKDILVAGQSVNHYALRARLLLAKRGMFVCLDVNDRHVELRDLTGEKPKRAWMSRAG